MKQKIIILFTALILCIGTRAETIQVINGLKYSIYIDENYAILINNNYTLSDIVIPASISWNGKNYPVTKLGNRCFSGCSSLTSVTIPSSVTSLGEMCFAYSGLTSVTIPSSVTSLGYGCFAGTGLTSVTIPSSVTSLGDECFWHCSSLKSVTIPSSVTSLGDECFCNCWSLKSVTIPSSVTSLGHMCFYGCGILTSVTIPSSVTSLGKGCFMNCNNLQSVNIQSRFIKIDENCFTKTKIDNFTIMATTPPSINAKCFDNINKSKLIVPKRSIKSYRAASGWGEFGYILPVGEEPQECEIPHISYANGKLHFDSLTPNAEYRYTIDTADDCIGAFTKNHILLVGRYDISCYAISDGYLPSKTATIKLYLINANLKWDGINPSTQMRGVVVSTENSTVTLSGLQDNERVIFYNKNGMKIGEARAINGETFISTQADVIFARIGNQSLMIKK